MVRRVVDADAGWLVSSSVGQSPYGGAGSFASSSAAPSPLETLAGSPPHRSFRLLKTAVTIASSPFETTAAARSSPRRVPRLRDGDAGGLVGRSVSSRDAG